LKVHVKLKDSDYLEFCQYQLTHSKQGKRTLFLQRIMLPAISVAMIIAFIALIASLASILVNIAERKKKTVPVTATEQVDDNE
jgi:hypothetical protein